MRLGSLILEAALALTLLATALVAASQLLVVAAGQRQAAEQRLVATLEAANAMEMIMARPWSEVTPETASKMTLSALAQERLREGGLQVLVTTSSELASEKRVDVMVRWKTRAGVQADPVELTAWTYAPQNGERSDS